MRTYYEIGPFRLEPDARVLTRDGVAMELGSRGVAVLTALVSRAGEYVEKSAIFEAAWPGLVVEEANVTVQVSAIRRVFAQIPEGKRWIETLTGRGYRFVGPVTRHCRELEINSDTSKPSEQGTSLPARAASLLHQNNIPAPISSFVGRTRETEEVKQLLERNRLVTLLGVGGIGKTRVALHVAADVVERYRDGVWLIELGSISDARLVSTRVAEVLGIQDRIGEPLVRTLCRHLKARQLLLVFDTCEHVIAESAALVAALLAGAPSSRVLATSREALNVDGEQQVQLRPMSLPRGTANFDDVAGAEAVQLFVERARLQQPGFALSRDVLASVAAVCSALEGIPLAIELAAARLSSMSLTELEGRLGDRFRLLATGPRASPPRQRTLRATLDWSYDLLSEHEKRALQRLAVFSGSFTREAAGHVLGAGSTTAAETFDLLATLVARSLILADVSESGTRYRLLDTMRAYCIEKLETGNERSIARRSHARYFQDRFEHALEEWLQRSDRHWNAVYMQERDNLDAALDWAFSLEGDIEIGIRLTAYSGPVWLLWSLRAEGVTRFEVALARCNSRTPQRVRARLWLWLGVLRQFSDSVQAVRALRRAVVLHRRAGDPFGMGYSCVRLASVLARTGRFDSAQQALDEAQPLLSGIPVPTVMAPYHNAAGFVNKLAGNLAAARTHYEEGISLFRSVGSNRAAAELCGSLADANWALGALDAAVAGFREAIALMRDSNMGTKLILGVNLTNLAGVLVERGDFDEALAAAQEGFELRKAGGDTTGALDHLALRAALVGRLTDAARLTGYVDALFTVRGIVRQINEARARARLERLLQHRLSGEERVQLMTDGATITEEDACRLAFAS